jgi:hydroxypyruvate isomerase
MPRFAANLSLLYNDVDFLDRFAAAAADGFQGVEFLFPYAWPAEQLAGLLKAHGLQQVLFNAPPGDWEAGERGLACRPGREAEFRAGFEQALGYARVLGCPRIHVMAGLLPAGETRDSVRATYVANLKVAAALAAEAGVDVLIEPINERDMPGFFLNRQDQAHALVAEIGAPNVKVQMDLYHCQIVEGDLTMRLRQWLPTGQVGHLQIAAVPDRGEPDDGELAWSWVFDELRRLNWTGWIGCEYRPRQGSSAGLNWLRALRAAGHAL